MEKPHFSCCFARRGDHLLLVRKTHPDWQAGRLNGVGGAAQPGESPLACAIREFREETGVVDEIDWSEFCTLEDDAVVVHMHVARLIGDVGADLFARTWSGDPPRNDVGEVLVSVHVEATYMWGNPAMAIDNLVWLIPMAFMDEYHLSAKVWAMRRHREHPGAPWRPRSPEVAS